VLCRLWLLLLVALVVVVRLWLLILSCRLVLQENVNRRGRRAVVRLPVDFGSCVGDWSTLAYYGRRRGDVRVAARLARR
jgi:hypothetical protein